MRRLLILALALAAVPVAAAGTKAHTNPYAGIRFTISGEIKTLGPQRIGVGKLQCSIAAKQSLSAGRFVVGDPVALTCLNGKLLSLKYRPEIATAQTFSSAPASHAAATTSAPATAPAGGSSSVAMSFGFVILGANGGTVSSTGAARTSASGPISALDSSSISVGDLTCSLPSLGQASTTIATFFKLGDDVNLSCYTGYGSIAALGVAR